VVERALEPGGSLEAVPAAVLVRNSLGAALP
jgi:hypothetical protein